MLILCKLQFWWLLVNTFQQIHCIQFTYEFLFSANAGLNPQQRFASAHFVLQMVTEHPPWCGFLLKSICKQPIFVLPSYIFNWTVHFVPKGQSEMLITANPFYIFRSGQHRHNPVRNRMLIDKIKLTTLLKRHKLTILLITYFF